MGGARTGTFPSKDLLSGVRVLEEGRLKIQRELEEAATLVRELTEIRVHAAGGGVQMGAEARASTTVWRWRAGGRGGRRSGGGPGGGSGLNLR